MTDNTEQMIKATMQQIDAIECALSAAFAIGITALAHAEELEDEQYELCMALRALGVTYGPARYK